MTEKKKRVFIMTPAHITDKLDIKSVQLDWAKV